MTFLRTRALADNCANADDAVLDRRAVDDAAVGEQRAVDFGRTHDLAGQKAGMGVDRWAMSKKLNLGSRSVKLRLASKNARMVPMSSQYP